MKRYGFRGTLGALLTLALLLIWTPKPAFAAQTLQGNTVTVASNQIIDDDLYSFGSTITIDGTVRGDVVAIGGTINIGGLVTGSVSAAGSTVTISGQVGGSVRVAGSNITVSGRISRDAMIAGGTIDITANAQIGRDLNVAAGTATLNGHVGRNVAADVQTLHIGTTASVHGALTYGSDKADIAPGAKLQGPITRTHFNAHWPGTWQVWTTGIWPAMVAFAWIRGFFSLSVLGLVFLLLVPRYGRRTVATLRGQPWASLGLGLAILIGVPIVAAVAFVLGVFIGGWWLALMALAIYAMAIALSLPVSGLFVGQWLLQRAGARDVWPGAALILGLALVMLVSLVPILGALVVFVAVLFGLGTLMLSLQGAAGGETKGTPELPDSRSEFRPMLNEGEPRRADASTT